MIDDARSLGGEEAVTELAPHELLVLLGVVAVHRVVEAALGDAEGVAAHIVDAGELSGSRAEEVV